MRQESNSKDPVNPEENRRPISEQDVRIGRVMRFISDRKGKSQREVAEGMDISPALVNAMFNGKRSISQELLEKFAAFHGVSVAQVYLMSRMETEEQMEWILTVGELGLLWAKTGKKPDSIEPIRTLAQKDLDKAPDKTH